MKEEKGPNGGNHNFSGKFKFSNVEFSTPCKCIANIVILISVYGSYLYLRLNKASTDKRRKQKKQQNKGQNRQEKKTKINFNNKNRENEKNYVLCRIVDGSDFYFVYKR